MLKIIFLILLLTPVASRAQFFMNLGAGVAIRPASTGSQNDERDQSYMVTRSAFPLIKISAGYQYKKFILGADMLPTVTRVVNASNYFGGKAGINIHGFVPAVGYYFNYKNSDQPENNSTAFGYSLSYQVKLNDRGGLFAEAMMIERSYQLIAGAHIQF